MRISSINNQTFKSFIVNDSGKFSYAQTKVAEDILAKAQVPLENYNQRSTIDMLKEDYDMDLFVDSNADKKSVNLYFAEKSYLNGDLSRLHRLTPVGIYDSKENPFDTDDVESRIIEIENGSHRSFASSLATFIMALGIVLIPTLAIANLIKTKNAEKAVETAVKTKDAVLDSLKAQKDTLDITKLIK